MDTNFWGAVNGSLVALKHLHGNGGALINLADTFTSGFADAFEQFASGAESAKKAFGDFIDSLFAQALKFVANQALAKILEAYGYGSGSDTKGAGLLSTFAEFFGGSFGGGKDSGGYVGPYSVHPVNELGPVSCCRSRRHHLKLLAPAARTGWG
jgi:hypothetical protein